MFPLYPENICPVGWGVEYIDCTSAEGVRPPATSVLDKTLNNLMVRFQQCWSFGEYGVLLYCHHSGSTLARSGST